MGINLTQEVKDIYIDSCIALRKDIEKDSRKWKDTSGNWTGRASVVKMVRLPKLPHTFHITPVKIPRRFLTDREKTVQKFVQNPKDSEYQKQSWMTSTSGHTTTPGLKLFYKATVTQTAWHYHQYRPMGRWNREEEAETAQTLSW